MRRAFGGYLKRVYNVRVFISKSFFPATFLAHLNSYNKDVLNKKLIHPYDIVGTVGGSGNCKDNVYTSHLHITYFDQNWRDADIIRVSNDTLMKVESYNRELIRNPFNHREK